MPGISVCGMDSAGGVIQPGNQFKVFYKGLPVAVLGEKVQAHGRVPHDAATMIQGSSKVNINGVPVVFAGCQASCGDVATGRPDFTTTN